MPNTVKASQLHYKLHKLSYLCDFIIDQCPDSTRVHNKKYFSKGQFMIIMLSVDVKLEQHG